jgi:hypothetical protein
MSDPFRYLDSSPEVIRLVVVIYDLPFETIDLNASGGMHEYVERYQSIYANVIPSVQWRADRGGPVLETTKEQPRALLPASELKARQRRRDRPLMALARTSAGPRATSGVDNG